MAQVAASTGTNVEGFVKDAALRHLEADAFENWLNLTDDRRYALAAHVEEGYLQAERGELIDGDQARQEIQLMKEQWRSSKPLARR